MAETEGRSLMEDMRDDGYRFSHDLISEVLKITAKIVQRHVDFPDPKNFLLTGEHRLKIRNFLSEKKIYFDNLVEDYALRIHDTKYKYGDFNYAHNRFKVIEDFKPEPYSEEDFVKFCAAFAQIAVLNYVRNRECCALEMALTDVHKYVKTVLSRGTLQHSSLAEND